MHNTACGSINSLHFTLLVLRLLLREGVLIHLKWQCTSENSLHNKFLNMNSLIRCFNPREKKKAQVILQSQLICCYYRPLITSLIRQPNQITCLPVRYQCLWFSEAQMVLLLVLVLNIHRYGHVLMFIDFYIVNLRLPKLLLWINLLSLLI